MTPTDLPGWMADDRVTLPLAYTRDAAAHLCRLACLGGAHVRPCLIPLLEERDALAAKDAGRVPHGGLDPDCVVGGAKHAACTGCICACHRPLGGAVNWSAEPMRRVRG